jgi:hypothetical protein
MAAAGLATAAPAGANPVRSLPPGGHAITNSTTVVYTATTPTATEQTFTVPAGVTSIDVIANGAAGGSGFSPTGASMGVGGAGGEGEQVSGTLAVIPGSTLYVEVGGLGLPGSHTGGGAGGFNGGGGGAFDTVTGIGVGGGGGGGASDIRTVSRTVTGTTLASRLIVAGGGGGGGGGGDCTGAGAGAGGAGGGGGITPTNGGLGGDCPTTISSVTTTEHGGHGGVTSTTATGGTGGTGGTTSSVGGTAGQAGQAGTLGAGGAGGTDAAGRVGGGGGGGGLAGGGGGGGGSFSTHPDWGGGGGGGAGSSFATTDVGATTDAAEVSITYTAPGPPPPVGNSDLKVFVKHQGVFQTHRQGTYGIWVTNTGTAATAKAHPMVVTLDTGSGIMMVQGGKGTDWQCHKQVLATTCTRSTPLGAGRRTMITVTVWVNSRAGKTRLATATVSPSDATPADNTATDKAIIRRH